jgi:hypothetical protein
VSSGGFTFLWFEFTRWGAVAEGLFVALELVEGAGRLARSACSGFAVWLFSREAVARFACVASAGFAGITTGLTVGFLCAKTASFTGIAS